MLDFLLCMGYCCCQLQWAQQQAAHYDAGTIKKQQHQKTTHQQNQQNIENKSITNLFLVTRRRKNNQLKIARFGVNFKWSGIVSIVVVAGVDVVFAVWCVCVWMDVQTVGVLCWWPQCLVFIWRLLVLIFFFLLRFLLAKI